MIGQLIGRSVLTIAVLTSLACSTAKMTTSQPQVVAPKAAASTEPTDEEWRWFARYREQALDALMPLTSERVLVAYRARHTISPSEMEGYFAIDVGRGYDVHGAVVVSPVGRSIGEQLMRLHRADPEASFESVLSRILVSRLTTDVEACPGLFAQMNTLHRVRVPMRPDPRVIHLDGMLHRIVVAGFVDVSDNDDDNPAARWAMQTLGVLTKCVRSR
jgi:hypothetical protein